MLSQHNHKIFNEITASFYTNKTQGLLDSVVRVHLSQVALSRIDMGADEEKSSDQNHSPQGMVSIYCDLKQVYFQRINF